MPEAFSVQTLYFRTRGPENTEALLAHASRRARELGLRKVVVATSSGETARRALAFFPAPDFQVVAVSGVTGFEEADVQELSDEARAGLEAAGAKVVTAAHAFGGVGRGIRNKLKTYQVDEIMAHTLRLFGQGTKVALEVSYMACDRGWVRTDEDVLAIAGSESGADTALVLRPANSHRCLDAVVREVVAKPWNP
ncbi:MAG: hypothetical protein HGA98_05460 [Deltaproteobacteria bacterium]|nr:hypothetical protein [Deltaproteobacteria bacterium]